LNDLIGFWKNYFYTHQYEVKSYKFAEFLV